MNVLHITVTSQIGGGPEHIFQLISQTNDQLNNFIACPKCGPYYKKYKAILGSDVVFIPHRSFSLKHAIRLFRYIKINNIGIIHCHGKGAGVYGKFLKILKSSVILVHTPHGINRKRGLFNAFYFFFERTFGFLISRIIYVSKSEAQLASKIGIWKKIPFEVIHNGTPILIDSKESLRLVVDKRWKDSTFKIITCSRFDEQKNTLEFIKIASLLPDQSFLILGDGLKRSQCQKYVINNKLKNVSFLGNVDNPKELMLGSHIYLSTALWEGLSIAIIEAMSTGLPIVASNVVGNKDLIFENDSSLLQNGFTYELDNISEACFHLKNLIGDKKLYSKLSNGAFNVHKDKFSIQTMADKVLDVYNSL